MKLSLKGLLFAGCATLFVLSSIIALTPAAQARLIALGTIQDSANTTCPPGSSCTLLFLAPASASSAKATYIETVSCWINVSRNTSSKPVITRLQLNQNINSGVHVFLAPIQVVHTSTDLLTHQVYVSGLNYYVPAGSRPQVIVEFSTAVPSPGTGFICAYTGKQDQSS
jgi:hypothetical protein